MKLFFTTKKTQLKYLLSHSILPTNLRVRNNILILQMGKLRLQDIKELDDVAPGLVICLFALTSSSQPSSALLAVQTIFLRLPCQLALTHWQEIE